MGNKRGHTVSKEEFEAKAEKQKSASKPKKGFSLPFFKRKDAEPNPRTQKIFGAAFLFLSVVLFLSFASYLFTWQDDQSLFDKGFFTLIFDSEIQSANWLGKLGALFSHLFLFNFLGISAVFFLSNLFILGVKRLLEFEIYNNKKLLITNIFLTFFLSVTLAYILPEKFMFLSGAVGYELTQFFESLVGKIGTGFFIVLIGLSYVIQKFNPSFQFAFKSADADSEKITEAPEEPKDNKAGKAAAGLSFEERLRQAELVDDELEEEPSDNTPFSAEETSPEQPQEIPAKSVEAPQPKTAKEEEAEESANTGVPFEIEDTDPEIELVEAESSMREITPEELPDTSNLTQGKDEDGEYEELEGDNIKLQVSKSVEEEELDKKDIEKSLKEQGDYDPKLDLSNYKYPNIELLEDYGGNSGERISKEELLANQKRIVDTLGNYKIEIDKIKATIGPTVTLYEIVPAPGVRISKIQNLEADIALSLAALGIRIIAPIPGKGTIGIEVPNTKAEIVPMRNLLRSEKFVNAEMELPVALGKTISNETFITDLAKMPHLLMAGATGQGKSVGLNAILVSLLFKKHPAQIKFVLVDPKKVELTLFNKIERHFLAKLPDEEEPIITDTTKVVKTLNSLCVEMDNRYELLKNAQCRNIKEYNKKFTARKLNPENGHQYLPYIVVVVDEFADLIMTAGKEVETPIARIAQLARAVGIHLIIATQRPSVNIITGVIKANFPARIAFRVSSKIDSRTILDAGGADQLIGRGDMLYSSGNDLIRLQCGFVDTPEVDEVCDFIGGQRAYPSAFLLPEVEDESAGGTEDFDPEDRDALFNDAAKVIVLHQQGSASLLQRKLKLGYNRAGRLIDQLEAAGIVGPFEGSKARSVLVPDEATLEQYLS